MPQAILLSDAMDEYLKGRVTLRKGTAAGDRRVLQRLLRAAGNIQARHLTNAHGEATVALLSQTCAPNTIHTDVARLKVFCKWLRARRYLDMYTDPFGTITLPRIIERPKLRIPAREFPLLLDAAKSPRDRLIVALGLYLFLRQSEMKELRLSHVDLDAGEVMVTIVKTATRPDRMPISAELDTELRRWLTEYHATAPVALRPDHFLVPAQTPAQFITQKGVVGSRGYTIELRPDKPIRTPYKQVQQVLERCGYATRDASGKALSEGVHTLRRSGARALFDRLLGEGYDGALRTVQSMLHHSESAMTERYLGIDVDAHRRNDLLKGHAMYGAETNVVRLGVAQ